MIADRLNAADLKDAAQDFIMANYTDIPAKTKASRVCILIKHF